MQPKTDNRSGQENRSLPLVTELLGGSRGHEHNESAHRLAWVMTHREPIDFIRILQRCGNATCFNPRHLEKDLQTCVRHQRLTELLKLSTQDTDDCVLWPFYRLPNPRTGEAGYGQVYLNGRLMLTSRAAWVTNGRTVPPKEDVCHSCDNPGCINLRHLFTGTRRKNMEDCQQKGRNFIPRGTLNPNAKLTENQVKDIRTAYRPKTRGFGPKALAKQYGHIVTEATIQNIVRGRIWKHLL